jgi:hypothetical protein
VTHSADDIDAAVGRFPEVASTRFASRELTSSAAGGGTITRASARATERNPS